MPERDAHPCGGLIANGTGCGECAWCRLELEQMPLDVNDWPAGIERVDLGAIDPFDWLPDTELGIALVGLAVGVAVGAAIMAVAFLTARV